MIIIGHDFVPSEVLYLIKKEDDIAQTPSNSTVVFEFSEANVPLCHYCRDNGVNFALIVDVERDAIFGNALGAAYLICDKVVSAKVQKLANEYMYDAKVLLYSSTEADMDFAAESGIDGIIFEKGIDYGSC